MQLFLQQIYNIIVINIFTRYYFKYYKFYYINIVSQPLKTQFKITKPYLITTVAIININSIWYDASVIILAIAFAVILVLVAKVFIKLVSQPLKTQFKITKPYLITSFCILQHKPMILYKKIANLL
jgi:hypothetical protein